MEKRDEVIAGLGACIMGICQSCPYGEYGSPRCRDELMVDAHNLIVKLHNENSELRNKWADAVLELSRVQQERDFWASLGRKE